MIQMKLVFYFIKHFCLVITKMNSAPPETCTTASYIYAADHDINSSWWYFCMQWYILLYSWFKLTVRQHALYVKYILRMCACSRIHQRAKLESLTMTSKPILRTSDCPTHEGNSFQRILGFMPRNVLLCFCFNFRRL